MIHHPSQKWLSGLLHVNVSHSVGLWDKLKRLYDASSEDLVHK